MEYKILNSHLMNNLKIISLLLLISLGFYGCEKIVDNVNIPEQQPKVVVNCYISPEDTLISAYVSLSAPIWSTTYVDNNMPVTNATVIISNNTTQAQLVYNYQKSCYIIHTSAFPIQADVTYKLAVSVPGYSSVEATCKVPVLINQSLQFLSFDSVSGDQNSTEYRFKVEFTDFSGIGNYYRIGGILISLYDNGMGGSDTTYNTLNIKNNEEFIFDKDIDGQVILSELNYWKGNYDMPSSGSEKLIKLKVFLLTTDDNYYQFHKTLSSYTGDDPFSEPTIVFSNVQNGLGVFASYRKYTINYNFPN